MTYLTKPYYTHPQRFIFLIFIFIHKLAIPAALLTLAGSKSDREIIDYRQLIGAQERRNQEIEFICSDVVASMGFSRQGHQADNSAVNCELVFDDGSSAGDVSNKVETMQDAADYQCVYPEVAAYKSKKPTPKEPACFVNGYTIDFSDNNALFEGNSSCSDFAKPPVNSTVTDRWCDRVEAAVSDVREEILYNGVACSCVHAQAVVTDERKYEIDLGDSNK